jgi:hypothetical protein
MSHDTTRGAAGSPEVDSDSFDDSTTGLKVERSITRKIALGWNGSIQARRGVQKPPSAARNKAAAARP